MYAVLSEVLAQPTPPWRLLPLPHGALGQAALRHLRAHLSALAGDTEDAEDTEDTEGEQAEEALLHEVDAADRALDAWRPAPPTEVPEPTGGAPARLPLPNGGWALRPAAGGLVLYDATGVPHRTLEGLEAVAQLARLGWQTPGLRAAFEGVSRGQMSVEQAIVGFELHPVVALEAGRGRRLQVDELRSPGGWPRALLLWEPGGADDAPAPLLLEGAEAVDQLSRAVIACGPVAGAPPRSLVGDLQWMLLHNDLPNAIPSVEEAGSLFAPGPGRPSPAALAAWLRGLGAAIPARPTGGALRLELRQTGAFADTPKDSLFAEAWSALDPDLQPGTWVAAWAWADEQGALRVRYDGLFLTDRGWRWLPKPWRASPRGR